MADDPFRPCRLRVEFVDAVAGARKTLTAIAIALDRAKAGVKTMFAMPTLELIREMAEVARRSGAVPVTEITSAETGAVVDRVLRHLERAQGGQLVFITHEAFFRVGDGWPEAVRSFELVIDETPEVILTRQPFKLRDSHVVLTGFLDISPVELPNRRRRTNQNDGVFTEQDFRLLKAFASIIEVGIEGSSVGEYAQAQQRFATLKAKFEATRVTTEEEQHTFFQVAAKDPAWARRRRDFADLDDVYALLRPIPAWVLQDTALFTDSAAWIRMIARADKAPDRGVVTISGFRRPDALASFARVTIMTALFPHTMLNHVWSQLGVTFVPSPLINITSAVTQLGGRRLRIYWLTDQGWSKRLRDRSGGIAAIFRLIAGAGVLVDEPVCIVTNKDDATEASPLAVFEYFPRAQIMPHNVRGQNRFAGYHQLIHCAALNSYTPDIRWMEQVLGIDGRGQRIARTGQEIYQSLMRLSLRDPRSTRDVTLVVMDRDVAEWLPQWFAPAENVEVVEIDSTSVVRRKGRPGRPTIGDRPMTPAERQARRRLHNDHRDEPRMRR